ncbi:MAG: acyl-CoA dehydrogenase family protein, partial [Acidimicrobiia bacterium]
MEASEYADLQAMARRFVEERLIPHEREVESGLEESVWRDLIAESATLGLTGLRFPAEYGGGGAGLMATAVVMREFGRTSHSFITRLLLSVDTSLMFGTEEQKERWLRPALAGELTTAFALTETESGSDAATLKTMGVRSDGGWVLSGRKVFTTLARVSDLLVVVARTGEGEDHRSLSVFAVPTDSDGVTLGAENDKVGYRGVPQSDVFLDECFVPDDSLIGDEGQGWDIVTAWTDSERLMQAAWCLGSAERALELAVGYAKERKTFGAPLATRQAIQWMIADSGAQLTAIRALVSDVARRADRGLDIRTEAASAKLIAAEVSGQVIDRCLQIHGGSGYMRDLPFDMLWRDVRLARIGGGT